MKIAIIAVAYNRKDSLERLLKSLESAVYPSNTNVPLIISVDKSDSDLVEIFAEEYSWSFGSKIVDKHEKNLGLRPHMMSLGKWFEEFDAIVVLEDDLIVSPNFYIYTQQTVEKYNKCENVAGISLYSFSINYQTQHPFTPYKDEYDIYFMNCAMSWGEVWMRESWKRFYDWYLLHQDFPVMDHLPHSICSWNQKSWLKYHTRYCIEENKYFVHPYISLTTNFSDIGEHVSGGLQSLYQVSLQLGRKQVYNLPDFGRDAVYYDGFFENKLLYEYLNIPDKDLCVDLQGEWKNRLHKRYWLTACVRNYKVIRSFGLDYRPIELNVFLNNPGKQLFLYDTNIVEANTSITNHDAFLYSYRITSMSDFIRQYGPKDTIFVILRMMTEKIKRILRLKNK